MAKLERLPVPEQKILETSKTTLTTARGKTKLGDYGFNEDYYTGFEQNIIRASSFKTDEELTKELESITKQKNNKLVEAGRWGEGVKVRLELAFPNNPEVANEFPVNFQKAKTSETLMLEVIPNINNLIDKYEVKLKQKGLPDNYKQTGIELREQIDTLNQLQEKLKAGKPQYTLERIAAYRTLYDGVNEINKTGRIAYAESGADLKAFKSPWPAAEKKSEKEAKKTTQETTN